MSVDVGTIGTIVSVVATIVGGYYALALLIVKQFKADLTERFKAQDLARQEGRTAYEKALKELGEEHRRLERDFLKFLAELPTHYMRREDHIRFETVINAKLDALAAKQDLVAERLPQRRD